MADESKYFYPCYICELETREQRSGHMNKRHRIEAGLYEPSVPNLRNPVLNRLNSKQELEELRGTQIWKVIKNVGDDSPSFYPDGALDINLCPQGFPRMKPPMDVGHVAARANHVNSEAAVNLVPMDPLLNRGNWSKIEKTL
ncbi:unnamed protein product [Orchesella dallaii]|uniref:Uncharacterized protein n=1 Tax=Orchesella dallaii TaxID=48710 RepID=A0ABP1PKH0_9HEXA